MFTTDPFRSSNLADAVCKKYKIHRYTVYQLSLVLFWHSPVKTRWWEARRESERKRERRNSEQTYARTKEGLKGHGRKKTTICVVFSVFGRMHLARELLQNNSYQTPFTVHRPPSTVHFHSKSVAAKKKCEGSYSQPRSTAFTAFELSNNNVGRACCFVPNSSELELLENSNYDQKQQQRKRAKKTRSYL